jgi:tRNA(Ile)-lysidine synthetase-like protein
MREDDAVKRVDEAVREELASHGRVVLAVSGGLDSMVLLEAAARVARDRIAIVATFDHGTGPAARDAAELVRARCEVLRVPVHAGRARGAPRGEAAWRAARWHFLRDAAALARGVVATAHTRDDQVETVLMRVMRGAGARGLAGLYADTGILRPLLGVSRATIARYAEARTLRAVVDPSNERRDHLRNRIRLDLLPAMRAVRPSLEDELLLLARAAAEWRRSLDVMLGTFPAHVDAMGALHVASAALLGYDSTALRVLWPALAARSRVTLDRRGTRRLAEFTIRCGVGARMQLSGGWEVIRAREELVVRRAEAPVAEEARALAGEVRFGAWRFRPMSDGGATPDGFWTAALPADRPLVVRGWLPGDRLAGGAGRRARRVKRYLYEAGIPAPDRVGWPVVLAGDEIVWVPGVGRSDAATVRSGRPVVHYLCDRIGG